MLSIFKFIFKILLSPLVLTLTIILLLSKISLNVICGIGGIISFLFFTFGIWSIVDESMSYNIIPAFIVAFLLSPIGIPLIFAFFIVHVEMFRDWIRDV